MFCPTLPSVASTIIRQISPSQVMLILSCLITDILDHLIPAVFEGFTESDDLSMIGLVFDDLSIWEYVVAGSMSTPPSGALTTSN